MVPSQLSSMQNYCLINVHLYHLDCPEIVPTLITSADDPLASTTNRSEGTLITWTCGEGYRIQGAEATRCKDGTWTNDRPTCVDQGK